MASNVFLFTWENKYSLDKELKRRKDSFLEKYWNDSVFIFNSENRDNMTFFHKKTNHIKMSPCFSRKANMIW